MPGHFDGIEIMSSMIFNPADGFADEPAAWAKLEKEVARHLRKLPGHTVKEVTIFHLHASALRTGRKVTELERRLARIEGAGRPRGPKGAKGAKGSKGAKGAKGAKGSKGSKGARGARGR